MVVVAVGGEGEGLKWEEPEGRRTKNLCESFGLLWKKLCVPLGLRLPLNCQ